MDRQRARRDDSARRSQSIGVSGGRSGRQGKRLIRAGRSRFRADADSPLCLAFFRFHSCDHVIRFHSRAEIYEVVYRATDPVVAGLGFASIRDFISGLKYGGVKTEIGDETRRARHAIGFGISQDGRFLRTMLYEGFNADEQGRRVFDGVWAHVGGAGRGSFNERFAQPSRDGHPFINVFYPVDIPPFGTAALLENEQHSNTVPKLLLSNGSYEYWGRCASLIHTTEDGLHDVKPPPGTRVFFFAGSQHSAGHVPPGRPANSLHARYGGLPLGHAGAARCHERVGNNR